MAIWLPMVAVSIATLVLLQRWALNGAIRRERQLPDASLIQGDRELLNRLNSQQLDEVGRALAQRRPVSDPALHPAAVALAHIQVRRADLLRRDRKRAVIAGVFAILAGLGLALTLGSPEDTWPYWFGRALSQISVICGAWSLFMARMYGARPAWWLDAFGAKPRDDTREASPDSGTTEDQTR